MQRERFKSRLGFLLLSAGCAIGLGNVWRFPYMVGQNGGAFFVLFYLLFLIIMGLPILSMELAVGRASRKSIIREFETLEKPGSKWHWYSPFGMLGNYMLMFFYTVVGGWLVNYFVQYLTGSLAGLGVRNLVLDMDALSPEDDGTQRTAALTAASGADHLVLHTGVNGSFER